MCHTTRMPILTTLWNLPTWNWVFCKNKMNNNYLTVCLITSRMCSVAWVRLNLNNNKKINKKNRRQHCVIWNYFLMLIKFKHCKNGNKCNAMIQNAVIHDTKSTCNESITTEKNKNYGFKLFLTTQPKCWINMSVLITWKMLFLKL